MASQSAGTSAEDTVSGSRGRFSPRWELAQLGRRSLAARFNTLAIGLILLTAFSVAIFLVNQTVSVHCEKLVHHGSSTARMVARSSQRAFLNEEFDQLTNLVDALAPDPDLAYVVFADAGARILQKSILLPGVVQPDRSGTSIQMTRTSPSWP